MKNNSIRAMMLTLGVACCIPCTVGNASGIERKMENAVDESSDNIYGSLPKMDGNQKGVLPEYLGAIETDAAYDSLSGMKVRNTEREELLDTKKEEEKGQKEQAGKTEKERSLNKGSTELRQLQIPEKLEVVVDPWEMDGKGQIYSKPYVIRNMGETPGTLTLSGLACVPRENSGVQVRSERMGLHESEEKAVYMQMMFGDGKEIVLSEENDAYQTKLQPGEELSIYITGEVNEYASEEWKDSDLSVHVAYLWEAEEYIEDTVAEEEEGRIKEEDEEPEKEPVMEPQKEKLAEYERSIESEMEIEPEDIEQTEEAGNKTEIDESKPEEIDKIEEEAVGESLTEVGKQTDKIEVQDPGEVQFKADAWETDEDGITRSRLCKIRNTGVHAGMFSLTKLVDDTEATEILVRFGGGLLNGSGADDIYIELIAETGEETLVSELLQKPFSQEDSIEPKYNIELSPGEEVTFRIVMKRNRMELENLEDRALTVVGLWTVEGEGEGLAGYVR